MGKRIVFTGGSGKAGRFVIPSLVAMTRRRGKETKRHLPSRIASIAAVTSPISAMPSTRRTSPRAS